jgi:hypothetical protein
VNHREADRGVGVQVEPLDALVTREAGVVDAAGRALLVAVVALAVARSGRKPR